MLAGSVASNTTLAAPDLIVLTMTEFADQIRHIMRASTLSLLVDATPSASLERSRPAIGGITCRIGAMTGRRASRSKE